MPLAPLALLYPESPEYVAAFSLASAATLAPLLFFERLTLAYGALYALYALALAADGRAGVASKAAAPLAALHALPRVLAPPDRFPDLYPALTALAGAAFFGLAFLYAAFMAANHDTKRKAA